MIQLFICLCIVAIGSGVYVMFGLAAYLDTLLQPGWAFLGVGQQIYICVILLISVLVCVLLAMWVTCVTLLAIVAVGSYRGLLRLRSKTNLTAHVDL